MAFKKILQIVGISFMMALSNMFGGSKSSNEYLVHLSNFNMASSA